ncbi:MAG: DNA methyltransferase [Candidatus Entotheonellia bacterium]
MKVYNSDITIEEFIARHAKPYDAATDNYFREPFAKDTKVGKNSAIYNAHSFHTKVPPEGIVPYILHYTEPGDLILDPFAGSGMTGMAAMMCTKPPMWIEIPTGAKFGARTAILNDLSPAACHIAYNYCTSIDAESLKWEFDKILGKLRDELDWLYGTTHDDGTPAIIQNTIWSDVFRCCRCGEYFILWDVAVEHASGKVTSSFDCPHCGFRGPKTKHTRVDAVPVVTNYEYVDRRTGKKKRATHRTTLAEMDKIREIEAKTIPYWYPTDPFGTDREMWRGGHRDAGITRICDFYTKRNLGALAAIWSEIERTRNHLAFVFTSIVILASRLYRYRKSGGGGPSLNLYPPSLSRENSVLTLTTEKLKDFKKIISFAFEQGRPALVTCSTASKLNLPGNCIDYIFTDPPYGSNIFYADCSLLWEAWLQDFTDMKQEAVWNKSLKPERGGKTLEDYVAIMEKCFDEMYRVLKPGRWVSMVFSNSDDQVWSAIRDVVAAAGFEMVDRPLFLDKEQRSFKQVKGEKGEEDVVGTDIILNLHKRPRVQVTIQAIPDIDETVLGILHHHLETLPERIQLDPARYADTLRMTDSLYNVVLQELMARKLSNRGVTLPYIDELCRIAFKKVEGKWYMPSEEIRADSLSFDVADEPSAIEWIRGQLEGRPMTLAELIPLWRQATLQVGNRLQKTLPQLLEENFWRDAETNRWRLPTADERRQMGDEHTLRMRRYIQRLREGKLDTFPTNTELFEWMRFAYQHLTAHQAVVEIYQRLNPANLSEADRKTAKRLYEFCVTQLPETDDAGQSDQPRLFQ